MARETFLEHLRALEDDLMKMGRRVDETIARALLALINRDCDIARSVIEDDHLINQMERDLKETCLVLLATQQPMAGDLRVIVSVFSIAYELERIADHAEGIAKITLRLADQPHVKPLIDIPRMADEARRLLEGQLQAFSRRDADAARRLAGEDDLVDHLYDQVYRELLVLMMEKPDTIQRATYLLWVAHNLERIADRTTNIGEHLIFLVTGHVAELNPPDRER